MSVTFDSSFAWNTTRCGINDIGDYFNNADGWANLAAISNVLNFPHGI